jgi:hypothetical protein
MTRDLDMLFPIMICTIASTGVGRNFSKTIVNSIITLRNLEFFPTILPKKVIFHNISDLQKERQRYYGKT